MLGKPWIQLNKDKVCFGARNDSYGNFTIWSSGTLMILKLVYLSGYVTCNSVLFPHGRNWACNSSSPKIGTIVTNANNKVIFPQDYRNVSYTLNGFDASSPELLFTRVSSPIAVSAGEEFRVWYHEDFKNGTESDNAGRTCTNVFGVYQ